ncbi:response regulator [Rhodoferax sp. UBA5149]|uniref:response regulator n=1 Tax=Rhodoferax sp. UBA5149 TaxID=1947379 RepID=UPI0025FDFD80|nr:response regulator [Rhodoferax sp. UBA5149]
MSVLRKILVVDDDAVVGKSFDRVLKSKGYAVITAQSGEEALLKLKNERYDVVFTDIKMPGMSGLEVAERVKKSQPWLPVVVITGYGTSDNEVRAEAAGVSGFLRKPLSPEMIEGSTNKALQELDAILAAPAEAEAINLPPAEMQRPESTIKNIALFFAAPFIGLAYIIALPFAGFAILTWMCAQALLERK